MFLMVIIVTSITLVSTVKHKDNLSFMQYKFYIMKEDFQEDIAPKGSLVVAKQFNRGEVNAGDNIIYYAGKDYFASKVLRTEQKNTMHNTVIIQDGNLKYGMEESEIEGKIVKVIPSIGNIVYFLRTTQGKILFWLIFMCLACAIFVIPASKKSVGKTIFVVVLSTIVLALIINTCSFANYTTVNKGTATADIAKWDVKFSNDGYSFSKNYTYVEQNNMAPGTSGTINMSINSVDTEVAYNYDIYIKQIKNKPSNLRFYISNAYEPENEIKFSNKDGESEAHAFSGTVELNSNKATRTLNPVIYWNWEYQTTSVSTEVMNMLKDSNVTAGSIESKKQERVLSDLRKFAKDVGVEYTSATTIADFETLLVGKSYTENASNVGEGEVAKTITFASVVNDAVDTVDGIELGNKKMQIDVEFIATQVIPEINN